MTVFSKKPSRLEKFFPGTYSLLYDPSSEFGKVSLLVMLGSPLWGTLIHDILSLKNTDLREKKKFDFSIKDISLLKIPAITIIALIAFANTPGARAIYSDVVEYVNSFTCINFKRF